MNSVLLWCIILLSILWCLSGWFYKFFRLFQFNICLTWKLGRLMVSVLLKKYTLQKVWTQIQSFSDEQRSIYEENMYQTGFLQVLDGFNSFLFWKYISKGCFQLHSKSCNNLQKLTQPHKASPGFSSTSKSCNSSQKMSWWQNSIACSDGLDFSPRVLQPGTENSQLHFKSCNNSQ